MKFSAVKILIAVNVLVFMLQYASNGLIDELFALYPLQPIYGRVYFHSWQIITYAFLHSTFNISHLLFNMLGLWMFGAEVERYVGPRRLLACYFASVVTAALTQLFIPALFGAAPVLYRRELARYEDEGHGHRVRLEGTARALTGRIDHDDRKPFSRWLRSQDRYMVIESRHLLDAAPGTLSRQDRLRRRVYFAPAVMFLYLLLVRRLVLDGWPGWFYVFQRTLAETLLALRLLVEREGLD